MFEVRCSIVRKKDVQVCLIRNLEDLTNVILGSMLNFCSFEAKSRVFNQQ